ncbi:MAG: EFR1 family ferrodoxin [Hungatella hathewayi]
MIFYFSGTGNSQLAAGQIAELLQEEPVSIHPYGKTGKRLSYHSETPWVFVAPTYAWRMPRVVEQWIRETEFTGSQDAYFVLTCGGSCGNAAAYAQKLCEKKNLHFCGLSSVVMPENYTAMLSVPDQAVQSNPGPGGPAYHSVCKNNSGQKTIPQAAISLRDNIQSGPVNRLFYPLMVHDKKFTITDKCISCGKCARVCPLENISMLDGKPRWNGNCTHCMACICGCPTEAIEYGTKSIGNNRYYIIIDK